jgi:hypothetical protein
MKLQLKTKQVIKYLPKRELAKQFPLTDYRSVSSVLSKPSAWQKAQLKDKNSPYAKATRAGTKMHKALEDGNSKDAFIEACLSIFDRKILTDIDEVWGQEEWLAHPFGYKGKFDGLGIYKGKLTLFDHKKTVKRKTLSGLTNWLQQLAAYKQAHEHLYCDHRIEQIAIFNIYGKTAEEIDANVTVLTLDQLAEFTEAFNFKLTQGKI